MRLVVQEDVGVVGLNFMWLPTWIGVNAALLKDINDHVLQMASSLMGQPIDDALLQQLHEAAVDYICSRFPELTGLRDYLNGTALVGVRDGNQG